MRDLVNKNVYPEEALAKARNQVEKINHAAEYTGASVCTKEKIKKKTDAIDERLGCVVTDAQGEEIDELLDSIDKIVSC